jgi:hypothetical protein
MEEQANMDSSYALLRCDRLIIDFLLKKEADINHIMYQNHQISYIYAKILV